MVKKVNLMEFIAGKTDCGPVMPTRLSVKYARMPARMPDQPRRYALEFTLWFMYLDESGDPDVMQHGALTSYLQGVPLT